MTSKELLAHLRTLGNEDNRQGMQRFGIDSRYALGIPIPVLRKLARDHKKNHQLAVELWQSGIHEARILASMVDDPAQVTEEQIDKWVNDFTSWDVCDQVCGNLFDKTPYAATRIMAFATREEEFVRRAAFSLIATSAVHNKKANNAVFQEYLRLIERYAYDDRNYVKKAVNWALRQIGKRNKFLHVKALATAKRILKQDSKAAKWIARDAIRELENEKIISRIKD